MDSFNIKIGNRTIYDVKSFIYDEKKEINNHKNKTMSNPIKKGTTVQPWDDYANKLQHLTARGNYVTQSDETAGNITIIGDDGHVRTHSAHYFITD